MGKIVSKTFINDQGVCDFLNNIKSKGINLNAFFIKITQGRSDMKTVFYDDTLEKTAEELSKPTYL